MACGQQLIDQNHSSLFLYNPLAENAFTFLKGFEKKIDINYSLLSWTLYDSDGEPFSVFSDNEQPNVARIVTLIF